jgi:exodeoxyribonuclease VII large subunit
MGPDPITETTDHNLPVFSVGEISLLLKRHVEDSFDAVRVRGEVSGFKRAPSGHLYFALKDADAVLDAVCWRNAAQQLPVQPTDGIEVIAIGRLTTYPARSKYQMVVERLELSGEGALLKLLEDRKRALAAEGLFDPGRKQPIPFLPRLVGVVTSPTGAVIRDILHRLSDRFPVRVLVWPVLVQGPGAAEQVARAIEGFNALDAASPVPRPDVLIVARGGGSLEDLWPFNEEVVVRAAAASRIPLVSAIGHETDTTLIDFAADLRAPTPTAAAEMVVPVRLELAARVIGFETRAVAALNRLLGELRTRVTAAVRGLPRPIRLVEAARQRLDDWSERLDNSLSVGLDRRRRRLAEAGLRLTDPGRRLIEAGRRLGAEARALEGAFRSLLRDRRARLDQASALLDGLSYERVLERGFVLVRDDKGRTVTRAKALKPGQPLVLRFTDGDAGATVVDPGGPPRPAPRPPRRTDRGGQGTLF